ncbi:MAG TPA: flippase-like domain-containing protein, partial [Chloroflexi bacterium]|nr:flippase-like domain-containing protein [Chloroflexota bacterium]
MSVTEMDARRCWYRNWRFWVGGAVSVVLIVWAAWALDWRQVGRALRSADVGWTALALATVLLTIAARVLRWRGLLLPQRFGPLKLLKALLVGQVVNYLVFSQLGIVARAAALGEGHRARALGTVALEKLWDVLMLLGLIVALSLVLTLPEWLALPARLLGIGAVAIILFLLATVLFRRRGAPRLFPALERIPLTRWLISLL